MDRPSLNYTREGMCIGMMTGSRAEKWCVLSIHNTSRILAAGIVLCICYFKLTQLYHDLINFYFDVAGTFGDFAMVD